MLKIEEGKQKTAEIVRVKGEAPPQYPDYDYNEDYDDEDWLSSHTFNAIDDTDFESIGTQDNMFSGSFYGEGHTITLAGKSLFGYIYNAQLRAEWYRYRTFAG